MDGGAYEIGKSRASRVRQRVWGRVTRCRGSAQLGEGLRYLECEIFSVESGPRSFGDHYGVFVLLLASVLNFLSGI